MSYDFYHDQEYRKKQAELTRQLWKEGRYNSLRKPLELRKCRNSDCNLSFKVKPYNGKVYCGSSCAAHITNTFRKGKGTHLCRACGKPTKRSVSIFCSFKCQNNERYNKYIERWKQGLENGNRGITTKIVSKHLRHFLLDKYQGKCSSCRWNKIHPLTKVVPLEINHIDGNSENNKENNLELLCPNCHALTPNFRNLNKGKGRAWRLAYLKNHS